MSTIVKEISQLKLNAVAAYNSGYRIVDGVCVNEHLEPVKYGTCKKHSNIEYARFYVNAANKEVFIHLLGAYQKYGNYWLSGSLMVRHLNSNSLDNRLENLALGTAKDNYLDIPIETRKRVTKQRIEARRLFSHDEVRNILIDCQTMTRYQVAKKYACSWRIINLIVQRKTYADVILEN